jgi:DNA polymerase-1
MKVVLYDAYNLIYRAKHALPPAMQKSQYGIAFAFFRSLAALHRKLNPDKAYFVTEGKPVRRLELLPEYKGTRKHEKDEGFANQRRIIIEMINESFPLIVANHHGHECDDVIAHLAKKHDQAGDEVIVVSTDTDFLQLANTLKSYKQYNPIRKSFVDLPSHDYVAWKALTGDASDNIVGFKGIGNKRALSMLADPLKFENFLKIEGHNEKYLLNKELISFIDISNEENMITFSKADVGWPEVHSSFEKMGFKSIVSERGWRNFKSAFEGEQDEPNK